MALFARRARMPATLQAAMLPDETVLANGRLVGGGWLAVTRFGLWQVPAVDDPGEPERWGWPLVSKVRWTPPRLEVTVADVVGSIGPAELIADRPPVAFELESATKLTDQIHQRVRSGIVAADHHLVAGRGLWLVVRRVPGRDGVSAQVRADAGADLLAVRGEIAELVDRTLAEFGPS